MDTPGSNVQVDHIFCKYSSEAGQLIIKEKLLYETFVRKLIDQHQMWKAWLTSPSSLLLISFSKPEVGTRVEAIIRWLIESCPLMATWWG